MMRPTRKLLILAVAVLGLGLCVAPQAEAGWGHVRGYSYAYSYGYSWGYSGCYAPCWTPVCAPVYRPICRPLCSVSVCDPCCGGLYVGIRPGPIRRAVFGPYRWYGSYGCCSVCYDDPCCCYSGDAVVSTDSAPAVQSTQKPTLAPPIEEPAAAPAPAAGTPNDPAPAPAPAPVPEGTFDANPTPSPSTFDIDADPVLTDPMPAPVAPPATDSLIPSPDLPDSLLSPLQPSDGAAVPATDGTISMLVPENARVTINGYVTKSSGRVRRYVAQNLKPGLVYPFNIQVNIVRDGRILTESRQVKLTGGALEAVVFNFDKDSVDRIAQAW